MTENTAPAIFVGSNRISIDTDAQANNVVVRPDGKIVFLSGHEVHQLNANGTIDTSFGISGVIALSHDLTWAQLTLGDDDRIFVTATKTVGSDDLFFLARYDPNGQLDETSFGSQGYVTTHFVDP